MIKCLNIKYTTFNIIGLYSMYNIEKNKIENFMMHYMIKT